MIANKIKSLIKNNRGMTLMDMAIALLVIGLIAAPLLQVYNLWKIEQERGETSNTIFSANKAISDFYFETGRYPCPAIPTKGPGDAGYGVADCAATAVAGSPDILTGSIPFVTIKLPESQTLDGFGNKVSYTVTKIFSDPAAGGIPIVPAQGKIVLQKFDRNEYGECTDVISADLQIASGQYALVSHGSTAVGAHTQDGVNVRACPANEGEAGWTRDAQNCNNDVTFLTDECAVAENGSNRFYDDTIYVQETNPTRIWNFNAADNSDIFSNATSIGINNPNADTTLDIIGNVLTTADTDPAPNGGSGNINSNLICPAGINPALSTDCFNPVIIGGQAPQMNCGRDIEVNQYLSSGMTGIARGETLCGVTYIEGVQGSCADDEYMVGIKPDPDPALPPEILCAPAPAVTQADCTAAGQTVEYVDPDAGDYSVSCQCPSSASETVNVFGGAGQTCCTTADVRPVYPGGGDVCCPAANKLSRFPSGGDVCCLASNILPRSTDNVSVCCDAGNAATDGSGLCCANGVDAGTGACIP